MASLTGFTFTNLYNTLKNYGIELSLPGPGGNRVPFLSSVGQFITLGDIISAVLPYIFILVGLILMGLIIMGGLEFLLSTGNPEKVKAAQGKITSALIGFIIVFLAYWIGQIMEIIFGIQIF